MHGSVVGGSRRLNVFHHWRKRQPVESYDKTYWQKKLNWSDVQNNQLGPLYYQTEGTHGGEQPRKFHQMKKKKKKKKKKTKKKNKKKNVSTAYIVG